MSIPVQEPKVWQRFPEGFLEGEKVSFDRKYLKDVASLYLNETELAKYPPDTVMYDVYSYGIGDAEKAGNLYWGLTVMYPVRIGGECNMTRGHFHQDRNCAEFYFGVQGEGLLVFMNEEGEMWAEKVLPGSLHYIDGAYAHRLVNTGDALFKVGACWPTTAGHDYAAIEKRPFPYRVYRSNGKIEFQER